MSKPLLQLAAVGVAGVILWQVLAGPLISLLFLVLEIALIAGLVMFALWFFKKNEKSDKQDGEAGSV